jgi:hypothetical protein
MITNSGLRFLGFEPFQSGDAIAARFHLFRIYAVQGIIVQDTESADCRVYTGPDWDLAIGNSINQLSKALLGDNYVDDEAEWQKRVGLSPPFLLLHVGPTDLMRATEGFLKRIDGALITHDCFPNAKEELAKRESDAIEPAVAALSMAFAGLPYRVELRACDRAVFGITESGETVNDFKVTLSGSGYVSSPLPADEIARRVEHAVRIQRHLSPDISRFYYLGLSEDDPLKQFLYHFLFIERYTHQVFKRIACQTDLSGLFNVSPRLAATTAEFSNELRSSAKSLVPRFVWCAILAWSNLTDTDVDTFKFLKHERDRLSHGELTSIDPSLAGKARDLSGRILQSELVRTRSNAGA